MIGIGPIVKQSLDFHHKKCKNFEEAKVAVAKEFLQYYLKYDDDELNDLGIVETQVAGKYDILYLAFRYHEDVKEIHVRRAEVKEDDVILRNYIPLKCTSAT